MSNPGGSAQQTDRVTFQALERAVGEVLKRMEALRVRAAAGEARSAELGQLLERFTLDESDAPLLLSRLSALEQENADLRGRIDKGREGVERLLARIRFLEEQR